MSYFSAIEGVTNLVSPLARYWRHIGHRGPYRPPKKCRPLKCLIRGFGAVRLTNAAGWKSFPAPDRGGPSSMFHEDGASTDVTGIEAVVKASIIAENGSLTSPAKLKPNEISFHTIFTSFPRGSIPKMASTTWLVLWRAEWKSFVKGMFRFFSWVASRYQRSVSWQI